MVFTILSDNRTTDDRFLTEHGLSVFVESRGRRLLFDTGASGVFIQNAQTLGIDLRTVDYLFLSHGHSDHTGGLGHFLEINDKAKIIMSDQIVGHQFYSMRGFMHRITAHLPLDGVGERLMHVEGSLSPNPSPTREGGSTQEEKASPSWGRMEGADDIRILSHIPHKRPLPLANIHLYVMNEQGQLVSDDFRHEMAIWVDGLLFTGCAHSGLLNILEACPWPVHTVVGGFHLLDARSDERYEQPSELEALAQQLKNDYPDTTFYTSHCTGDIAFATMQSVMGSQLQAFSCGMQVTIEEE